jgi:hypothetical protein
MIFCREALYPFGSQGLALTSSGLIVDGGPASQVGGGNLDFVETS